MFPRIPVLLVPLFLLSHSRAAESGGDVFTDPANAGPDFAFQGEYVGDGCAAQVIAEGDGKFHIVGFTPGLPGTSSEVEKKVEGPAQRDGNKVVIDSSDWKGEIVDGVLTGTNKDGKTYRLNKTERKSPTLGAKPPEGAVILFDGSSADQWDGGKLTPEGLLAVGVKSKRSFQSGKLHVEFRTPFMPKARGQGRGNSGVYLQDRYEVQVLDSFGLKGENNECGGIYSIAKPKVNMAFPPLSWQTYDIDFEAAEYDASGTKTKPAMITVRHNGVLIHDRVEVSRGTTAAGRKEGAESGPIQLQNHGNPVVYRNIWFVPKS
jgi:Domain of Unknown Function (DUF1080)